MQAAPAVAQYCRIFRTESVFLYISNETVCQRGFYTCAERETQLETGFFGGFQVSGGRPASDERPYCAALSSNLCFKLLCFF